MFKLLRFYSISSFISIFITAALLALFYREVTIHWITQLAERSNLVLAQTVLNSIRPELLDYQSSPTKAGPRRTGTQKFSAAFAATIESVMQGTSVVRINIYNRNGIVTFSTNASQIGTNKSGNAGFMEANSGKVVSTLVYRDTLNRFEKVTEADNLLETYIPVRGGPGAPIQGVFEIYTDVNQMVHENERMLFIILAGAEFILALLYGVLVLVVRRARNIIETQQQTIQERTAALEALSHRLLKNEEVEKKKIATDLHEGLAQTLSAIKANVENSRQRIDASHEHAKSLESIVPVIQSAIQEVRTIATELRPSSLDDLGVIPTLRWFCREFVRMHPEIRVEQEISLLEEKIPAALKSAIYRIIVSAFNNIAHYSHTDRIGLALHMTNEAVTLIISDTPAEPSLRQKTGADPQLRFAEIRERTTLSGGIFAATRNEIGGVTLRAAWPGTDQRTDQRAEQN